MAMLEIKDLHVHYGVIEALKGISLEVNEGEIVALIGANGAGKTTMMQSISGIVKKSAGEINFLNESIMKANPKHIVEMGLTQVPEGRRIFTGMSVYENLMMGAFLRKDKDEIKKDYEDVFKKFPRLKERLKQNAGTLSGGEQQRVAIARAIVNAPKLLICDEPTGNLDPDTSLEIMKVLEVINNLGTTVIVVTHDRDIVNKMKKRVILLDKGRLKKDFEKGTYDKNEKH